MCGSVRRLTLGGGKVEQERRRTKKNKEEQEGQHPLTGQRAPPISGGT